MYLEFDTSWNDDGSEGQRMRANGRHHNGRHARVNHGGSSRHGVGSRARWGRHNQTCPNKRERVLVLVAFTTATTTCSIDHCRAHLEIHHTQLKTKVTTLE